MIEEIIGNYLMYELNQDVYFERPETPPTTYIVVEKTGSELRNHIYSATIAIQAYANSMYEASSLNESVKEVMLNIVTLDDIGGVRLNSDYNFTDTSTKQYRYQSVWQINLLGGI